MRFRGGPTERRALGAATPLAAATADSGAFSLNMQATLGRVKGGLFRAGGAPCGRRCSTEPNEQAPAPVHASSLYRATRQGWGPIGQPPSWLLPAHSPGHSRPLSRPERHGCHSTSQSTPTPEVTARAQIARARLGLVTKRCLEVPHEYMQGGSLWPGRALERQRSAAHDPCCAGGWGSRLSDQGTPPEGLPKATQGCPESG